jgi:hypothetical protein
MINEKDRIKLLISKEIDLYEYYERSGILEYDGNLPHVKAGEVAFKEICKKYNIKVEDDNKH